MPKIEAVEGGVRVTFKRKNVSNSISLFAKGQTDPENTEADTTQKTTQKTTQTIIELIRLNPHITRKELAEKCKITVDGIKWQLQKMQERNLIRRVGADNVDIGRLLLLKRDNLYKASLLCSLIHIF